MLLLDPYKVTCSSFGLEDFEDSCDSRKGHDAPIPVKLADGGVYHTLINSQTTIAINIITVHNRTRVLPGLASSQSQAKPSPI
jgi:hypothetical protein